MSWWVSLLDQSSPAECDYGLGDEACPAPCYPAFRCEPFEDGGTFILGGSGECCLNITYNYSRFYYRELDGENGLRAMDGEKAGEWIARLAGAVEKLGTRRDENYWAATEGNAGAALSLLLAWARAYPQGVWRVA